jgi:farnesol dehydrogenase
MQTCDQVYHLAALAVVWSHDRNDFHRINYTGTMNVLDIALKLKIKKVVVTSTAGVFGPSENMEPVNENTIRKIDYFNEYEKSKDLADKRIMEHYAHRLEVCIVCPSRVFGPGELSESSSVTKMILLYQKGKFRFLPGNGESVGNYVYISDVVRGMEMAMEKGRSGERYILGGANLSFTEFFEIVRKVTGKNYRMIHFPVWLLYSLASLMVLGAKLVGIKPLITPGWARKYMHHWLLTSEKAERELGYSHISFERGLQKLIYSEKNQSGKEIT